MCSATETARFYSPGTAPLVFDVDGFRFGCLICIEVNFPALFMEYNRLGVDCVPLSAYPMAVDDMFRTKALARQALDAVQLDAVGSFAPRLLSILRRSGDRNRRVPAQTTSIEPISRSNQKFVAM